MEILHATYKVFIYFYLLLCTSKRRSHEEIFNGIYWHFACGMENSWTFFAKLFQFCIQNAFKMTSMEIFSKFLNNLTKCVLQHVKFCKMCKQVRTRLSLFSGEFWVQRHWTLFHLAFWLCPFYLGQNFGKIGIAKILSTIPYIFWFLSAPTKWEIRPCFCTMVHEKYTSRKCIKLRYMRI